MENETLQREYYKKYKKVSIKNHQNWFEVFELPHSIFAICEPRHFQEVNSFLICGTEKALLFDTGLGFYDIYPLVKELFKREVIVLNSHAHFDHIGNNDKFEEIHAVKDTFSNEIAANGVTREQMGDQLDERMFTFGYPMGFDPQSFTIRPYKIKPVKDGEIFDLGERQLKVILTPGHSTDCMMLYDMDRKVVMAGDMFYLGPIFAHFDDKVYGCSDIRAYHKSLVQVMEQCKDMKYVYASHGDPLVSPDNLREAVKGIGNILCGKAEGHQLPDYGYSYLKSEHPLLEYPFDDFSIIVKSQ